MYGGKQYTVKLRCINRLADSIIDQFGANVWMVPVDSEHFTVSVPVEVSPTFFAWLSTFGRQIKVLEPTEVVGKYRDFLKKALEMYKDDGEM